MPYPAFSIVADDLTGACDAAAPFANRGWSAWVTWRLGHLDNVSANVVSVCTKSRADSPSVAAEKTRLAAQCLRPPNSTRPFKKIDSTLKGNWTHEVLAALRRRSAIIAPAYPARGRCFVEIETGIPTGRIEGGPLHGLRVATKAGGFGDQYAIHQIVRFLQEATPSS